MRLSALGDVVHALPTLAALREALPGARLGWLVEDRCASLLAGHPQLDRLHVVPRGALSRAVAAWDFTGALRLLRRTTRELRAQRYDVALDLQSNLRSSLLARLSGAPRLIGQPPPHAREGSSLLHTETPGRAPRVALDAALDPAAHKIERNLTLLAPLGIRLRRPPRPVFPPLPPPPDLGPRPRVLLHPGVSAFGALKLWPLERFADLARRLVEDGATVWIAWGGAAERAAAEEVAGRASGARVAPATASLLELLSALAAADLFVGVDSGPLHLAAALGTPALGLYGPKDPRTYGPYWEPARVARSGIECSPCRFRRCPRPDARVVRGPQGTLRVSPCMDRLEVEAVLAHARALLAARTAAPRP